MDQLFEQRGRVIREFCTKAYALEVGEEFFQCFIACLPKVAELKEMLNGKSLTKRFKVWPVINGVMVKREA